MNKSGFRIVIADMGDLLRDVRYAIRSLGRAPGFTLVAVLALALGIGANTGTFSVINTMLLRPLPYPGGERLVQILETKSSGDMTVAYPDFLDWRAQSPVFEEMAIGGVFPATLTGLGPAERVAVNCVSWNYLAAYGAAPSIGRGFTAGDDREGAPNVAILTHGFFEERFGGNPQALGQKLTLDNRVYTIVGVLPPSFRGPGRAQVYAPISGVVKTFQLVRGNHDNTRVVARAKPGVSLARMRAEMDTVAARLAAHYPGTNSGIGARVTPLRETLAGDARRPAMVLLAAVGLVLLIACVNVANLLLARAAARRHEISLRAALGASRGRLLRQLLTESVLLSVAAGGLGLLIARWSFSLLTMLVPAPETLGAPEVDYRVLAFTLLLSAATGVLFGLVPALWVSRTSLAEAIRSTSGGVVRTEGRLRAALVTAEVALAFVLLAGTGLLLRSFQRLMSAELGFRSDHVIAMQASIAFGPEMPVNVPPRFYNAVAERVQALPGVVHAGFVKNLPFSQNGSSAPFWVEGKPVPERGHFPQADFKAATPGFYRALGIPLLKGRLPDRADGTLPPVPFAQVMNLIGRLQVSAVLSESMAAKYWPGEDPIGKRFHFGTPDMPGPLMTVVGVVGDTKQWGLGDAVAPTFYFSAWQFPDPYMHLVVRTAGDPRAIVAAVREIARQVDATVPLTNVRLLDDMVSDSMAPRRANLIALGVFAALALGLAAMGVYAVVSYSVAQRTREIGVRMALGSTSGAVLRSVLSETCALGAAGVAAGILAALALTRALATMLYGVRPFDAVTFASAAALLLALVALAGILPARRAMQTDPIVALHYE